MNAQRSFFCDAPLDPAAALRPGRCRSCGASIVVPDAARFCPRCGALLCAHGGVDTADAVDRFAAIRRAEQTLPPLPPSVAEDDDEDEVLPPFARLAAQAAALDDNAPRQSLVPPPATALRNFHSDVLIAYATALFRLGWQYERGRGTHRNRAEAIRCYWKSARLGNRDAAARLDPRRPIPPPLPPLQS